VAHVRRRGRVTVARFNICYLIAIAVAAVSWLSAFRWAAVIAVVALSSASIFFAHAVEAFLTQ
jgi:hypothetical protein